MGATGAMMAGSSAANGISAFGNAYSQSQAQKTQGEYQRMQFETNARMAEIEAKDSIERGTKEAEVQRNKGNQVVGAQRARLAAQGVNVDTGSAAEVVRETKAQTREDMMTIKQNAWREAWGYKVQALNYASQGEQAYSASRYAAKNTLLTGGMQAIGAASQTSYYASNGYGSGYGGKK